MEGSVASLVKVAKGLNVAPISLASVLSTPHLSSAAVLAASGNLSPSSSSGGSSGGISRHGRSGKASSKRPASSSSSSTSKKPTTVLDVAMNSDGSLEPTPDWVQSMPWEYVLRSLDLSPQLSADGSAALFGFVIEMLERFSLSSPLTAVWVERRFLETVGLAMLDSGAAAVEALQKSKSFRAEDLPHPSQTSVAESSSLATANGVLRKRAMFELVFGAYETHVFETLMQRLMSSLGRHDVDAVCRLLALVPALAAFMFVRLFSTLDMHDALLLKQCFLKHLTTTPDVASMQMVRLSVFLHPESCHPYRYRPYNMMVIVLVHFIVSDFQTASWGIE